MSNSSPSPKSHIRILKERGWNWNLGNTLTPNTNSSVTQLSKNLVSSSKSALKPLLFIVLTNECEKWNSSHRTELIYVIQPTWYHMSSRLDSSRASRASRGVGLVVALSPAPVSQHPAPCRGWECESPGPGIVGARGRAQVRALWCPGPGEMSQCCQGSFGGHHHVTQMS